MLFHEAQLLSLAKVAFLVEEGRTEKIDRFGDLGEALLIVTDLIDRENNALTGDDPSSSEGSRNWQLFLAANGLFDPSSDFVADLARSHDLYLVDKPHLHSHGHYIDLPSALHRATNLGPDEIIAALFAIAARWLGLSESDILASNVLIRPSTYFQDQYSFSDEEVRRFFELVSDTAGQLGTEVRSGFAANQLRPFDPMPFGRAPIALFGDVGVLVSAPLLRARLGEGLHHLFLRDDVFDRGDRHKYLQFRGAVFEDYVDRLFLRCFGSGDIRYVDGNSLRRCVEGKACDGAVNYGESVLLFETKATLFPLGVRQARDWENYVRCISDVIVDGAIQIASTTKAIERGELKVLGLDPKSVRRAIPLIITLERMPQSPLLTDLVREELARRGAAPEVIGFLPQVMNVGELEVAEIAMSEGRSLLDLVVDKATDQRSGMHSFTNWWFEKDEPFLKSGHNPSLSKLYWELGKKVQKTITARQPLKESGTPPDSQESL